jgi:hypothetical protein
MVRNIDDSSARCPGFESLERLDDGSYEPVTILSYQRFKFKLYQMASRIIRNVYFNRRATLRDVVEKVKSINSRLLEWEQSIPDELRLSSYSSETPDSRTEPILKIFRRQALALQLSYDNMQLILHRPLLAYDGSSKAISLSNNAPRRSGRDVPVQGTDSDNATLDQDKDVFKVSKTRCWESAMRTSRIGEHPDILKDARNTYGAAYAGIQAFTAGVMLAIFALSNPLSTQAQESKRAISRLIKMPKLLGYRTAISDQCGVILEELIRLILAEEMKSLVSEGESDERGFSSIERARATSPTAPRRSSTNLESPHGRNIWPSGHYDLANTPYEGTYQSNAINGGSAYYQQPNDPPQLESTSDQVVPPNLPYEANEAWMLTGNFNDALMSLQQGNEPII